jgi:Ca2+-binding EF-hand superfamily protein
MMKKLVIIGAAAAALIAVPTIAQIGRGAHSGGVTRTEIPNQVREGFLAIDRNRDGFVTQAEANSFRTSIRGERGERRRERRQERFERLDQNRDGAISREEFFARVDRGDRAGRRENRRERRAERRERRMERRADHGLHLGARAFQRMDSNRDGRVSLAEATEQRLRRFDRLDANRDGRITREERRSFRAERRGNRV